MLLIKQLTSTLDIIRESLAKHNSIVSNNENETETPITPQKANNIVTQMDIDTESHKSKEIPTNLKTTHRKTRAPKHE